MAQKLEITFVDDIDGSAAEGTTTFGIDGREFEIDLSAKNRARLEKTLAPFIGSGRKVSTRRKTTSSSSRPKTSQAEVRAWGQEHGYKVSARGRIPSEVTAGYEAAH